jgi:uncharacterized protein involved in exopolysaccharide biosynthesis
MTENHNNQLTLHGHVGGGMISGVPAQAAPFRRATLIRDTVEIMFRSGKIAVCLAGAFLLCAVFYIVSAPSKYQSEMTLLIKNDRADVVVTPGQTLGIQGRPWIDDSQVSTEMQLLSSNEVLRAVVEKCKLAIQAPRKEDQAKFTDKAVEDLRKEIAVTPSLKANIIRVSYASEEPALSATVLQALADAYIDRSIRVHSTRGAHEFFHTQAQFYERRLREAQAKLTTFQGSRDIIQLGQQKDLILKKLVDLQSAVAEANVTRRENHERVLALDRQIGHVAERIPTTTKRIPNQYTVERLTTEITDLENKKTELLTKFRPEDRMVTQVNEQIANTRAALARASAASASEESSDLNPVRQLLESELAKSATSETGLRARMQVLASQVRDYQDQLRRLESATAENDDLLRIIKDSEDNYFLYSKKQEEARIAEALDLQKIANVTLVDPPRIPRIPNKKLTLGLLATLLLGSVVIVAIVITCGALSTTIYKPAELEAFAGLPVFATIPLDKTVIAVGSYERI